MKKLILIILPLIFLFLAWQFSNKSPEAEKRNIKTIKTQKQEEAKAKSEKAPEEKVQNFSLLPCQFKGGETFYFDLNQRSQFSVNPGILLPTSSPGQVPLQRGSKSLKAVLAMKILRKQKNDFLAALSFREVDLKADGASANPVVAKDLEQMVYIKMDSFCRVLAIATPENYNPNARTEWLLVLNMTEFISPGKSLAESWFSNQSDTLGDYKSQYRKGSAHKVFRKKDHYYLVNSPNQNIKLIANILDSNAEAQSSKKAGDWYESFKIKEHIQLKNDKGVFIDVNTTMDLSRKESYDFLWPMTSVGNLNFSSAAKIIAGPPPMPYIHDEIDPNLINRSLKSVAEEFKGFLKSPDSYHKGLKLLTQWLRLKKGNPKVLLDSIRNNEFGDDDAVSFAFLSLELAGGENTHKVLLSGVEDSALSEMNRIRALSAYYDSRDANDSFIENMFDIRSRHSNTKDIQIANSAMLGIGSLSKQPGVTKEGKTKIRSYINQEFAAAKDENNKIRAMAAMGNSKDKSFLDKIKDMSKSPNERERANAYRVLIQMGEIPLVSELLRLFLLETSSNVKTVLAEALERRKGQFTKADLDLSIVSLAKVPDVFSKSVFIKALGPYVKK